jgi:hypothetical protein
MGWVIAGGCVAAFALSNRIIAHLHPRGSFERVSLNCLSAVIWLCLGVAGGLIVSAPL